MKKRKWAWTKSVQSHLSSPMSCIRKSNALSTLEAYLGKIFFKAKHLYTLKQPGAHNTDPNTCSAAWKFIGIYTAFIILYFHIFTTSRICDYRTRHKPLIKVTIQQSGSGLGLSYFITSKFQFRANQIAVLIQIRKQCKQMWLCTCWSQK